MTESIGIIEKIFGPRDVVFSNGMRMTTVLGNEPTIQLKDKGSVVFDLHIFAPEGTVIKYNPKKEWHAVTTDKIFKKPPELSMGRINGVASILDFLHECGHLVNEDKSNEEASSAYEYNVNFMRKPMTELSKERLFALRKRHEDTQISERIAWAYALRSVRRLEKDFGIDIVNKMGGVSKVIDYVNGLVARYEDHTKTELEYLGHERLSRKMMLDILAS